MAREVEGKSIKITFTGKGGNCEFTGVWRRSEIETAFQLAISKLPAHIAKLKEGGRYERRPEPTESTGE